MEAYLDYFIVEGSQEGEEIPVLAIAASIMQRPEDGTLHRHYTKERKNIFDVGEMCSRIVSYASLAGR